MMISVRPIEGARNSSEPRLRDVRARGGDPAEDDDEADAKSEGEEGGRWTRYKTSVGSHGVTEDDPRKGEDEDEDDDEDDILLAGVRGSHREREEKRMIQEKNTHNPSSPLTVNNTSLPLPLPLPHTAAIASPLAPHIDQNHATSSQHPNENLFENGVRFDLTTRRKTRATIKATGKG